jgi:hypothetical protein
MKRILLATSIAFPIACISGVVGLNCGSTTGTYVPPGTGDSGNGGSSSGSAGSSSSGSSGSSSGAAGSSSGSSGGAASSGSSGGAGSSSSGSGGSSSGAAPVTIDGIFGLPNAFGESVKDSFILFGCYSQAQQDCITNPPGTACPNQNTSLPMEQQGLTTHEYFTLGGTVGTMYKMTLTVNAIAEAKYYENGTRAAGIGDPPNPDIPGGTDTMYTGGDPVNIENYNIYKITVRNPPAAGAMPATGVEVQHYYLNSFPKTSIPYENHQTFPISFTHDIPVPGGGVIEYSTADRNCHAVDNCGIGFRATTCAVSGGVNGPRNVPNEPSLVVPTNYMGQPVSGLNLRNGASQPFHSHIFHITVTAVSAM